MQQLVQNHTYRYKSILRSRYDMIYSVQVRSTPYMIHRWTFAQLGMGFSTCRELTYVVATLTTSNTPQRRPNVVPMCQPREVVTTLGQF